MATAAETPPQSAAGKLRAKSPGKNLSPYMGSQLAAGKASPTKKSGNNHISTMKSLGLLHELQVSSNDGASRIGPEN